MLVRRIVLLSAFVFGVAFVMPFTVYAQEEDGEKVMNDASASVDEAKEKSDALLSKVSGIMRGLDAKQAQHFYFIYSNYAMISTVNEVEKDLAAAVKACGENNSGMKDDLDADFSAWQDALKGPKEEALANVMNMVSAQDYLDDDQFSDLLEAIDGVRFANANRFEKIPVTSPEACEFMASKMDETQNQMVSMLKTTLMTYPAALQNTQQ